MDGSLTIDWIDFLKIGVMTQQAGWILSHITKKMCAADARFIELEWTGKNTVAVPKDLDAIYYVDVQGCFQAKLMMMAPDMTHVGMFTHLDKDSPKSMDKEWMVLDGIVHMCGRYFDEFERQGWYKAEQMCLIPPGEVKDFTLKPLVLGVCQRGGFPGKGDGFLQEALQGLSEDVRDAVIVQFKGTGWDLSKMPHNMTVWLDDKEDRGYQEFYNVIDYLLIPSLWEGGPMAFLEALATGTPVIASDVGFVTDYIHRRPNGSEPSHYSKEGHFIYDPGDVEALQEIIAELVYERLDRRAMVEDMRYRLYAERVHHFISETIGCKGRDFTLSL